MKQDLLDTKTAFITAMAITFGSMFSMTASAEYVTRAECEALGKTYVRGSVTTYESGKTITRKPHCRKKSKRAKLGKAVSKKVIGE